MNFAAPLLGLLLVLHTPLAGAASSAGSASSFDTTASQCQERINRELAKEQRLFRVMVYGRKAAEDEAVGAVRYDSKGTEWFKAGPDAWRSPADPETTLTNQDIQDHDEFIVELAPDGVRQGFFETKRVLTSDFIPMLTQSARALQCRLDILCEVAKVSIHTEGATPKPVKITSLPGCLDTRSLGEDAAQWGTTLQECHLAEAGRDVQSESLIVTSCNTTADYLLRREFNLLKAVTEYDASYRSMLQFAGNFDLFLQEFRWAMLGSLRQVAPLIGYLDRIPCFLSSCEEGLSLRLPL